MRKLIVCVVALMMTACAQDKKTDAPAARPSRELIAFGDSVTSMPGSWATMVSNDIKYPLNNQAEPGTACQQEWQIGRIRSTDIRPQDIVVFLTGYNNLRGSGSNPDLGLPVYKPCLQEALEIFAASGAQTYIGTTMTFQSVIDDHMLYWNGPNGNAANALTYANEIKAMVAALNAPNIHVVDVNALWPANSATEYDFVHPTPLGHRMLADLFTWQICGTVRPCVMP